MKIKNKIKLLFRYKVLPFLYQLTGQECPDGNHTISTIEYDKDGWAHSKCLLCGYDITLKGKTLGEIDPMTVKAVDALLPKGHTRESFLFGFGGKDGISEG